MVSLEWKLNKIHNLFHLSFNTNNFIYSYILLSATIYYSWTVKSEIKRKSH